MSKLSLADIFNEYHDDFLEFRSVINPKSRRPDICAYIMLDELMPGTRNIVSSGWRDVLFIDVDIGDLEKVITEEQVRDLIRCGVRYDIEYDCLTMAT